MKKIFITLAALVCAAVTVNAQTLLVVEETPVLTNKKGERILPQAGDIAIGVSATPFFNYFGNMFTRDGNNVAPTFSGQGASVYMKFFMRDNQALRLGVNANFSNQYYYASNVPSDGNAGAFVTDQMKVIYQGIGASVGYEWRRGFNRLQGFYGAEIAASYNRRKVEYDYGNTMDATNQFPTTWNFASQTASQVASRTMEEEGAGIFAANLYGFIGAEYFFLPKLSIGGELRLGIGYTGNGDAKVTNRMYDNTSNQLVDTTVEQRDPSTPSDGFSIRTLTSGNIFLTFYF